MIGLERNSDLVKMASYAPLLEHYDVAELLPNLVSLDSPPRSLAGSTSSSISHCLRLDNPTSDFHLEL
jgi:alpha-N-arabinofuranosidase